MSKIKIYLIICFIFLFAFSKDGFSSMAIKKFSFDQNVLAQKDARKYCFDFSNILPREFINEINESGAGLKNALGIDFILAVIPSLEGLSIDECAKALFLKENSQSGKTISQAAVILIAVKEGQVKVEIGDKLKKIYSSKAVLLTEKKIIDNLQAQVNWQRDILPIIEGFVQKAFDFYKISK